MDNSKAKNATIQIETAITDLLEAELEAAKHIGIPSVAGVSQTGGARLAQIISDGVRKALESGETQISYIYASDSFRASFCSGILNNLGVKR